MSRNYKIEDLYQGGYSSLNPNYQGELFTGYRTSLSSLGVTTDGRTADILKEVSDKIAPGQKVVELTLIQPEILEAIPKQQLKEVNRLSKLTGVDVTVHGTLIEPSGITKEGFSEANRELAERQIAYAVERAHEVNPNGNSPVTFHSSVTIPGSELKRTKEGEEILGTAIINQETGQIGTVKKEVKYLPYLNKEEGIKKESHDVKEQLKIMNNTEWHNSLQQLIIPKDHADKIITETAPLINPIIQGIESGKINPKNLTENQKQIFSTYNSRFENANEQLQDIHSHLNSLFDKAYKYGTENEQKYLKNVAKDFGEIMKSDGGKRDIVVRSKAIQSLMEKLRPLNPEIYKPVEEFALDKTSTSFGNVAWKSYEKFGDKAPILSIENPPAGGGFSRGEDLKNIVEKAREKFVENAVKEGMSENNAKTQAEKLIGVTWDVGHINQLRKFGFSGKDVIKEAEKVAPFVKHVHLSDNFGMENTELPMGMGNVDLKEVMKKLGDNGKNAKKIVEAFHWWQFQKTSPMGVSMEAMGSPVYSMNMAPYWNQAAGLQQGYFSGYGEMLPSINYETFGAGFSNLPAELGGSRQGARRGRMGGTPME